MKDLISVGDEDNLISQSRQSQHSKSKAVKTVHGPQKPYRRLESPTQGAYSHASPSSDGKHKRVSKACDRCRMRKIKVIYEYLDESGSH